MYNLQVCACLSMSKGGWIINVCSSQHLSVHVSGKGNNRTFYILQVTSYFSDPGARNLILSKLGNLCFSLNGILAVINPYGDVCYQKKACVISKTDVLVFGWTMFSCHGVEGPAGLIHGAKGEEPSPALRYMGKAACARILWLGDGGVGM